MPELNIVEKVIALEGVELLGGLTPDQLARIASIAREVKYPPGRPIFDGSKPMSALYVVIDGAVELRRGADKILDAGPNQVLGAWALFDEEPMGVSAETREDTRLLSIARDDFYDLLADHIEITAALFSTLVKRFRKLVESQATSAAPARV